MRRAVLLSEIGLSFEELSTLTPKEQNDLIEGWNILEEEKADNIDEPDI